MFVLILLIQVYTSACYLLTDLYVPETAINNDWDSEDSDSNEEDSEQSEVNLIKNTCCLGFI